MIRAEALERLAALAAAQHHPRHATYECLVCSDIAVVEQAAPGIEIRERTIYDLGVKLDAFAEAIRLADELITPETVSEQLLTRWRNLPAVVEARKP